MRLSVLLILFIALLPNCAIFAQGSIQNIKVTEVHYHPPDASGIDPGEFEFIEFKNVGVSAVDISSATFSRGFTYRFPPNTQVNPGQFIVLSANEIAFKARYGFTPFGEYEGQLANGGERITLEDAQGTVILDFTYNDKAPWPESADGGGYSLVSVERNPTGNPSNSTYWRPSTRINGSPGANDPDPNYIPPILVNEILAHTDPPDVDVMELYNPTPDDADLEGWFLTDDPAVPEKYTIPAGTTIRQQSYLVILGDDDGDPLTAPPPNYFGYGFSLSSHGESIYLFSPDKRYIHGFSFDASENGASFGRYVNSDGVEHFPTQKVNSFGAANVGPKVGPIVISEIMYNPPAGEFEFLELTNVSNQTIPLYDPDFPDNTWDVGGFGFAFPLGIEMRPGEALLIIENAIPPASFAARYSVPAGVQIFSTTGSLDNGGETLRLKKPDAQEEDRVVPYVAVEEVKYYDSGNPLWPPEPDNGGPSLERIDLKAYGNESINWRASVEPHGTPGRNGLAPAPRNFWLIH